MVTPPAEGPRVRDQIPGAARSCGPLLAIFVDPFCPKGAFNSIYDGPFKVDWFVSERAPGGRRVVWSGHRPPPRNPDAHPWDWAWWLWCKIRSGQLELARLELTKLWQFLSWLRVPYTAFPPVAPEADPVQLERLLVETTLPLLPAPDQPVAGAIARAIAEGRASESDRP